ncbi:hypothetical protein DDV87_08665, partial [Campylobacter jejuni]|uniref:hypothetical protein n=1 Tax=Campylobacter jejuni TaxID=197 RepID=UPI000D572226
MQKQYPEVHSLEESLAILKKYKDDLTKEQYEGIKSVICGHAIEDMFANADAIIAEYKREWGVRMQHVKSRHRSLQSQQ